MTLPLSAMAMLSRAKRSAEPLAAVINLFNPVRSDQAVNKLYDANGALTTLQAFAIPGLFPVTAGMRANGFCWSVSGARKNWLGPGASVIYYNAQPAGTATFVQRRTDVTSSSDTRTIICPASTIPVTGQFVGISLKWGDGPSNAWTSSNVIPDGELDAVLPYIMVNEGVIPACLTPYGEGSLTADTTDPELQPGELLVAKNGLQIFHRSVWGGYDFVARDAIEPPSRNGNAGYQYRSGVRIDPTTPAATTPGAFAEINTDTAVDAEMVMIESDNEATRQVMSGLFIDGQHSGLTWIYPVTGHGKTLADVGDRYQLGSKVLTLADVTSANSLTFLAPINGTGATDWTLDSASPGTGTMTRVAGTGPNGGDITAGTAPTGSQFYPALQAVARQLATAEGVIEAQGVYRTTLYRAQIDSFFPNMWDAYAAIWARTRDTTPFYFNAETIPSMIRTHREIIRDGWRGRTILIEREVLIAHQLTWDVIAQWQLLTRRSANGETIWKAVPGTLSLQSGTSQSGGNAFDFGSALAEVTSQTSDGSPAYYFAASSWKPGSYWSDAVQRPPRLAVDQVKSSGGAVLRTRTMASSAVVGRTAANDFATVPLVLSGPKKSYFLDDYTRTTTVGEVYSAVHGEALMDPDLDPEATALHIMVLPDGSREMIWWRDGVRSALGDHVIPLRADCAGRTPTIINQGGAAATVAVVDGQIEITGATGELYLTVHFR